MRIFLSSSYRTWRDCLKFLFFCFFLSFLAYEFSFEVHLLLVNLHSNYAPTVEICALFLPYSLTLLFFSSCECSQIAFWTFFLSSFLHAWDVVPRWVLLPFFLLISPLSPSLAIFLIHFIFAGGFSFKHFSLFRLFFVCLSFSIFAADNFFFVAFSKIVYVVLE